jgi:hypothetical protein
MSFVAISAFRVTYKATQLFIILASSSCLTDTSSYSIYNTIWCKAPRWFWTRYCIWNTAIFGWITESNTICPTWWTLFIAESDHTYRKSCRTRIIAKEGIINFATWAFSLRLTNSSSITFNPASSYAFSCWSRSRSWGRSWSRCSCR